MEDMEHQPTSSNRPGEEAILVNDASIDVANNVVSTRPSSTQLLLKINATSHSESASQSQVVTSELTSNEDHSVFPEVLNSSSRDDAENNEELGFPVDAETSTPASTTTTSHFLAIGRTLKPFSNSLSENDDLNDDVYGDYEDITRRSGVNNPSSMSIESVELEEKRDGAPRVEANEQQPTAPVPNKSRTLSLASVLRGFDQTVEKSSNTNTLSTSANESAEDSIALNLDQTTEPIDANSPSEVAKNYTLRWFPSFEQHMAMYRDTTRTVVKSVEPNRNSNADFVKKTDERQNLQNCSKTPDTSHVVFSNCTRIQSDRLNSRPINKENNKTTQGGNDNISSDDVSTLRPVVDRNSSSFTRTFPNNSSSMLQSNMIRTTISLLNETSTTSETPRSILLSADTAGVFSETVLDAPPSKVSRNTSAPTKSSNETETQSDFPARKANFSKSLLTEVSNNNLEDRTFSLYPSGKKFFRPSSIIPTTKEASPHELDWQGPPLMSRIVIENFMPTQPFQKETLLVDSTTASVQVVTTSQGIKHEITLNSGIVSVTNESIDRVAKQTSKTTGIKKVFQENRISTENFKGTKNKVSSELIETNSSAKTDELGAPLSQAAVQVAATPIITEVVDQETATRTDAADKNFISSTPPPDSAFSIDEQSQFDPESPVLKSLQSYLETGRKIPNVIDSSHSSTPSPRQQADALNVENQLGNFFDSIASWPSNRLTTTHDYPTTRVPPILEKIQDFGANNLRSASEKVPPSMTTDAIALNHIALEVPQVPNNGFDLLTREAISRIINSIGLDAMFPISGKTLPAVGLTNFAGAAKTTTTDGPKFPELLKEITLLPKYSTSDQNDDTAPVNPMINLDEFENPVRTRNYEATYHPNLLNSPTQNPTFTQFLERGDVAGLTDDELRAERAIPDNISKMLMLGVAENDSRCPATTLVAVSRCASAIPNAVLDSLTLMDMSASFADAEEHSRYSVCMNARRYLECVEMATSTSPLCIEALMSDDVFPVVRAINNFTCTDTGRLLWTSNRVCVLQTSKEKLVNACMQNKLDSAGTANALCALHSQLTDCVRPAAQALCTPLQQAGLEALISDVAQSVECSKKATTASPNVVECTTLKTLFIQEYRSTGMREYLNYMPACKTDGSYQRLQCSQAGSCWCADELGIPVKDTFVAPMQTLPNCGGGPVYSCERVPDSLACEVTLAEPQEIVRWYLEAGECRPYMMRQCTENRFQPPYALTFDECREFCLFN